MFSMDMNRNLWRDLAAFEEYLMVDRLLRKIISEDNVDPKKLLAIANHLDDVMQAYEKKYGPIEDPLFFWLFATVNAFFLQFGRQLDELGTARIGYIVNSYKEGLNKHLLHPSYTALALEAVFDNLDQFANDNDKRWAAINRSKFRPIPD